ILLSTMFRRSPVMFKNADIVLALGEGQMVDHAPVTVNGRQYRWPQRPTVVICCDGSEPEYMERGVADGLMPNLAKMIQNGADLRGDSIMPSFTNPNNLSIVTG